MTADAEATLAAVLAGHRLIDRGRVYDKCRCRWYGYGHEAHVAEQITAHIAERLAAPEMRDAVALAIEAADDEALIGAWRTDPGANSIPVDYDNGADAALAAVTARLVGDA